MTRYRELGIEELTNKCNYKDFEFETTKELEPLDGIIGQGRASSAMEFGLSIKRAGYNIYVSGQTGTGRSSYTKSIINSIAQKEKTPRDWCYVYNFKNTDKPIAISLPAGIGHKFERDMKRLVKSLKIKIPKVFDGEEYEKQRNQIIQEYQEKSSSIMEEFNEFAKSKGFIMKKSEEGLVSIPVVDGKTMDDEEYMKLSLEERKKIDDESFIVQSKLLETMKHIKDIEKIVRDKIEHLETKIALVTVEHPIMDIKEKYSEFDNVLNYFQEVQKDIIHNISDFRDLESEIQDELDLVDRIRDKDFSIKYKVNLIVDNRDTNGAPVVHETNPKYYNLLGKIEYESNMGVVTTDFTKIKAGSLHLANGGYIIINMNDIVANPETWEGLKRSLKNGSISIENIYSIAGIVSGGMKPEPIPIDVKVIIIGNPNLYHTLYHYDEDFRKLFKIKADFDIDMISKKDNIIKYSQFISSHCEKKGLMHFDKSGVGAVIEYSRRLAEHKNKLSTRFNDIVEVLYEADAWSRIDNVDIVTGKYVKKAIEQKNYRSNRIEEKLQEYIDTGVVLISTENKVVGQVNGLSVMNFGDYSFGKPSRITAVTYAGEKGIINIEREVEMSGSIHDKGVLILSGYLGEKFAQDFPLALSASICFEQLYDGVEGDSASSTELYALLSSLSDCPVKQYIAVTGSVNQMGEIQPIGGVNEKIEGFFDTCKARGLVGNEGVMIPHQNIVNLMLNEEVVTAVEEGKFHIYSIKTIEEGIELLTDLPAGKMNDKGECEEGTIFYKVKNKLKKYACIIEDSETDETSTK